MYLPCTFRGGMRVLPYLILLAGLAAGVSPAFGQAPAIVKRLQSSNEKMELTVNTSRIVTLDAKIPRALVNNPEIIALTPLSPTQIQLAARKPGVTQVNLWDEYDQIYTIDVVVLGDSAELEAALRTLYPTASPKVYRYSNSLVLDGFVDRPDSVSQMVRLAEDYSPKVINNISVGGVQQILLNVQVYEVSRTKIRAFGFDFANINGNDFVVSSIGGLLTASGVSTGATTVPGTGDTVRFGVLSGGNAFFGFVKALRENDLMKVLAEPKLVTTSGRPASFQSGGEFPVLVPQSLGTVSIQYKKFGTQVEFLPVVLGNGNIRLEVNPRVSEIDNTRSVVVNSFTVPGLRTREVNTAVEMKAGQTLALAGLIQNRVEAKSRAIPWLGELPWIGAAFRSVDENINEIELLILVRPELVDPLDPHEVPTCLPGMSTDSPSDVDLFWRGHIEVPACNGCRSLDCLHCNPNQPGPTGYEEPATGQGAPLAGRRVRKTTETAVTEVNSPLIAPPTNRQAPPNRNNSRDASAATSRPTSPANVTTKKPTLIGPVGYDIP